MNFENLEFHIIDYNKIMAIVKQKSIYNSNKPIYSDKGITSWFIESKAFLSLFQNFTF